jgi:hypothetical protein
MLPGSKSTSSSSVPKASPADPVLIISNHRGHILTMNNDISHRDKQHDTEVREIYNPAVKQETIRPTETEEQTTAIDRELHQDHFQTRVQPVEDHVQEETKHSHKVLPVQHREQHHGKDDEIKKNLAEEVCYMKLG